MKGVDINRFSFAQMTSNSDGKTSASGTMGALVIAAGTLGFLVGVVEYFVHAHGEVMTQSIVVITIGAGLLGYRKSKPDPGVPADTAAEPQAAEVPQESGEQKLNS